MDLFTFLLITIILCSLLLCVQSEGNKTVQVFAVMSIGLEILYLLLFREAFDLPMESRIEKIIPFATGIVGLVGLFKLKDRSIPLLIFFASLLQFFIEMNIIDSIR